MLVRVLLSILSIIKIVRTGEQVSEEEGCKVILTERDIDPFSWMKYIVLPRKDWDGDHAPILVYLVVIAAAFLICLSKEKLEDEMVSQYRLRAIGVSRNTINAIESGKYVPSTVLALKIARHFGKPVDHIFQLDEND